MVDYKKLRELAEAAMPGRWEQSHTTFVVSHDGPLGGMTTIGLGFKGSDAAFIAAANPTAVIALLDEVERLRGADAIATHSDAQSLAVSMASFIAAIDTNSNDVAAYIESRISPLLDEIQALTTRCDELDEGYGKLHREWYRVTDLAQTTGTQLSSQTRLAAALAEQLEEMKADKDAQDQRVGPRIGDDPVTVARRWNGNSGYAEPDFDMHPEETASFLAAAVIRQGEYLDDARAAESRAQDLLEVYRKRLAAMTDARDKACDIAEGLCKYTHAPRVPAMLAAIRSVGKPRGES